MAALKSAVEDKLFLTLHDTEIIAWYMKMWVTTTDAVCAVKRAKITMKYYQRTEALSVSHSPAHSPACQLSVSAVKSCPWKYITASIILSVLEHNNTTCINPEQQQNHAWLLLLNTNMGVISKI